MKDIHVNSTTKLAPDTSRKEAIRAYYAMRELAQRVEAERDELRARIKKLDDLVKIQLTDGNWNYDPYMHGMANALLVAQAVMNNSEFEGLEAPEKWLDSREGPVRPTEATP